MSLNSFKLLYRNICKNVKPINRNLFRENIKIEIESFNGNKLLSSIEKDKKLEDWNSFINNYLKMKYHITLENELLESYNINVPRDGKRDIESVARRVGLQI